MGHDTGCNAPYQLEICVMTHLAVSKCPRNHGQDCTLFHITNVYQKGISKLEGGLILYPCREITDGNQAINMLIVTQLELATTYFPGSSGSQLS